MYSLSNVPPVTKIRMAMTGNNYRPVLVRRVQ